MIWDLPTRSFHWLFATCMVGAYISGENEFMEWHARFGVTILGLLAFRVIWGLIGPHHVRFSTMFKAIKELVPYLQSFWGTKRNTHEGHNPLGALSVIAFLLIATTMVITGLFNEDDVFFTGPLYYFAPGLSEIAHELHEIFHAPIIPLILLHLAAIAFHRYVLKENIIQRITKGIEPEIKLGNAKAKQNTLTAFGLALLITCLSASHLLLYLNA